MAKTRKKRFGGNVVRDAERQRAKSSGYGYLMLPKDVKLFKESADKIRLDIIPYIVSDEKHLDYDADYPEDSAAVGQPWYKKPFYVHKGVGASNESVVCPSTIGKKCPICEYRDKQFKDGVDKEDAIAKPSLRNLYVVIPIGMKSYEQKYHIWDISQYLFQAKLNEELEENPDFADFPNTEDGRTLRIRFSEETFNKNAYFETSRIDFEDRKEQYDEEIMDEAPDLDSLLTILSYKELEAKFLDLDEDEEDDDDKSVKRSKAGTKDSTKSSRKQKDEEDDDDDDDDNAPKPGTRHHTIPPSRLTNRLAKPAKKKDDADDEDDDDEVVKPARSRGVSKPERSSRRASKNVCPSEHVFGKDWDEFDDCDDCPLFDKCGDASET